MKLIHLDSFVYIQIHGFEEVKFPVTFCKSFVLNTAFDDHPTYTFTILYIFSNIPVRCIKCASDIKLTHFRDSH